MTNFVDLKVPVFSGINDLPIMPTALKAGNGSHLIATINSLIDSLEVQSIANSNDWIIVKYSEVTGFGFYTELNKKYMFLMDSDEEGSINISFPGTPNLGDKVTMLKVDNSLTCYLEIFDKVRGHRSETATLNVNEEVTFTYLGTNSGWTFNNNSALVFIQAQL